MRSQPKAGRPTTQRNHNDPPTDRPRYPSGDSPPRSRGWCHLGRFSASLEGLTPPRAILHLARGPSAPSGDSPPRSRPTRARDPRAHFPDQSIKCSGTPWVPGSKANPRHAGPLTPPGNHIPVLFSQPSPRGHPWHCTGAVREGRCQLRDTVLPTPVRPPCCTPRKRIAEPSKEVWTPTPRPRRTTP
jgi:hypothetical protein